MTINAASKEFLIVGNWKMNGSLKDNKKILHALMERPNHPQVDVNICAPFVYLSQVQSLLKGSNIAWGAQNVSSHDKGSYTGDISASMLTEFGCSSVIIGHSERRQYHNEYNEYVGTKTLIASKYGITPIICVGESYKEHKKGLALESVRAQIQEIVRIAGQDNVAHSVIGYEPIWAVGTGMTPTLEDIQAVHACIHETLGTDPTQTKILYGGSVKPDNAKEFFSLPNVSGGLIGGCALKADEFSAIIEAAESLT